MVIEARAAVKMGICDDHTLHDILNMLQQYNLPINTGYDVRSIANACLSDKKREGEGITMVFPEKIGGCILKKIPVNELESVIQMGMGEI
jgi:3-dehydroquinate synthetase